MAPQRSYRLLLIFGLFLLASLSVAWVLHWNSEEPAVYEATIREAFDEAPHYVILDTTQPDRRFGISNFDSSSLNLPLSARASYTAKNLFRFRIAPTLSLPHPFTMVSQEELDMVYRHGQIDSPQAVELRSLLQKSWGVITLSRVGFDLSGKHAVVYAQLTYCGLCGEGTYLYLSKESGTWHIVRRVGTWIS
jgi:hypothetical protein